MTEPTSLSALVPEHTAVLTMLLAEELTGTLTPARLTEVLGAPACPPELRRAALMNLTPASLKLLPGRAIIFADHQTLTALTLTLLADLSAVARSVFPEAFTLDDLQALTAEQVDVLCRLAALSGLLRSGHLHNEAVRQALEIHWAAPALQALAVATSGTAFPDLIPPEMITGRAALRSVPAAMNAVQDLTGAPNPAFTDTLHLSNTLAVTLLVNLSVRGALSPEEKLDWNAAARDLEVEPDDHERLTPLLNRARAVRSARTRPAPNVP